MEGANTEYTLLPLAFAIFLTYTYYCSITIKRIKFLLSSLLFPWLKSLGQPVFSQYELEACTQAPAQTLSNKCKLLSWAGLPSMIDRCEIAVGCVRKYSQLLVHRSNNLEHLENWKDRFEVVNCLSFGRRGSPRCPALIVSLIMELVHHYTFQITALMV